MQNEIRKTISSNQITAMRLLLVRIKRLTSMGKIICLINISDDEITKNFIRWFYRTKL